MKTGWMAAALAAVTVAAAACKDSTGIAPPTAGSLAFSYTGALSGSYSANGLLTRHNDSSFVKQSFASGLPVASGGQPYVVMLAYAPTTASAGDQVIFLFPSVAAGQTLTLTEACAAAGCSGGLIAFHSNPDLVNDGSDPFYFTTGTIHINSFTNGRVSGTFSGTAVDSVGTRTITVTGGTFDVPVRNQGSYPAGNRLIPTRAFAQIRKN